MSSLLPIKQEVEQLQLKAELVYESSSQIPGSMQYSIRRFMRPDNWMGDDLAMLYYHYESARPENNRLELHFCMAGNTYCDRYKTDCSQCKAHASAQCQEKLPTVDVLQFVFSSTLLEQFVKARISTNTICEDLLTFRHPAPLARTLSLCGKSRMVLEGLLSHNYSDTLENIYVNAQTQMLLLYSLDCMDEKQIDIINCKFLSNEADREKILKAREILIQKIGEPITIKELSRKVAMNECYLKKGLRKCSAPPSSSFTRASGWNMPNTSCMKKA